MKLPRWLRWRKPAVVLRPQYRYHVRVRGDGWGADFRPFGKLYPEMLTMFAQQVRRIHGDDALRAWWSCEPECVGWRS